ncbi:MAG TPA: hypothetical protein VHR65_07980 [Solirubrobacterales bacterium]|nr:hypothetical protein [Solirubrobacterales bacterium]
MAERERVVMLSGGAGSWGAARRIVDRHGADGLTLLFADTLIEDDDLYRFLLEGTANLLGGQVPGDLLQRTAAIPPLEDEDRRRLHLRALAAAVRSWCPMLEWIAEGRDPHQVFRDKRYLGNTRVDPCSAVLKRQLMRRWLEDHCAPAGCIVVLGYDWSEVHRLDRAAGHWAPWRAEAPLCDRPYLSKEEVFGWMEAEGLRPPRLYGEGFRHNNCGGFCVKGGQASFALLLRRHPERYRYHERREQELRDALGKDVAILRDRSGGTTTPLTMRRFRRRLECDSGAFDRSEWGACSCMEPTTDPRGGA